MCPGVGFAARCAWFRGASCVSLPRARAADEGVGEPGEGHRRALSGRAAGGRGGLPHGASGPVAAEDQAERRRAPGAHCGGAAGR